VRIINTSKGVLLADKARIADTFWGRLIGLLNRGSLEKGEALVLKPSYSIHTLFMRFAIDVIFLDKFGKTIGVLHSFKPFRLSPLFFRASCAIELPGNTLKLTQTQLGDIIRISKI